MNIASSAEKVRSEKEADAEAEQIEVMEIDSEEAPQPPKVNPHSRTDMETRSKDSTRVVVGARRARAATLPIPSTSRKVPEVSDDEVLLKRRLQIPMQLVIEPKKPVRSPLD